METNLDLEAGAHAFGDGTHPTTAGVLAALKILDPAEFQPETACDMGSGSGILTLAIAEKFGCHVLAVDSDRRAVETLRKNASRNGCGAQVDALQADGFKHPAIENRAPFDLITMNILARPLLALAADAERHLAPGGALILSGILIAQEDAIREAYAGLGLERTFRVVIGDWVTLIWQKP